MMSFYSEKSLSRFIPVLKRKWKPKKYPYMREELRDPLRLDHCRTIMNKQNVILKELSDLARRMFECKQGEVYLYGSRARGDSSAYSDWDILVVTDDSISSDDDFKNFAFPFAELGWKYGEQITPIHFTRSQWLKESSTPFYHNVNTESIRL